jgi:hypothetical protein
MVRSAAVAVFIKGSGKWAVGAIECHDWITLFFQGRRSRNLSGLERSPFCLLTYNVNCLHTLVKCLRTKYNTISLGELIMKTVQVKRVVETVQEFPGLGKKIRQTRERDKRTLTAICKECGLSRSYWYQLENEDLRSPATEEVIRRIEEVLGTDFGVTFE